MPVHLNVYDLTPFNGYAYWLGLGVYHSGVQGWYFKFCYVRSLLNIFSGFVLDLILNLLDRLFCFWLMFSVLLVFLFFLLLAVDLVELE